MKVKGVKILTWIMVLNIIIIGINVATIDLMTSEKHGIIEIFLGLIQVTLGISGVVMSIMLKKLGILVNAEVTSYIVHRGYYCYISYKIDEKEYTGAVSEYSYDRGEKIQIMVLKRYPRIFMSKRESSWLWIFIFSLYTILGLLSCINGIVYI